MRQNIPAGYSPDAGLVILNLGCGEKVSCHPDVINIDKSINLLAKKYAVARYLALLTLRGERLERIKRITAKKFNFIYRDLRKELPFGGASVDMVYHSHLIEHLERDEAGRLFDDIYRVLKKGGVHRIAAPDFHRQCSRYLEHYALAERSRGEASSHEEYIDEIIGMIANKRLSDIQSGNGRMTLPDKFLAYLKSKRGHVHRWMYDSISMVNLLERNGYSRVYRTSHNESEIAGWKEYGLEVEGEGKEWRSDSFYVEAVK